MSEAGKRRSLTSHDVARAAGVSQTTVSLVFSGRAAGRVSEQTRRRVEDVAAELGYMPSGAARVLRGGRPQVVALAVPTVRNEYFSRVLLGAEHAARDQGLAVILVDTTSTDGWLDRLVEMDRIGVSAGAIVYAEPADVTARLAAEVRNVVFVECADPVGRPAIDLDMASGMRQVVAHLWDLGHRRIGHAQADVGRHTFRLREQFLVAELRDRGIEMAPSWKYRSNFDLHEATSLAVEFVKRAGVTAVFCDDDLLVAALYRACARLGLRVPDDLSLVGFNDVDLTRHLAPEATSVAIPAEEIGARAVRALISAMNGSTVSRFVAPLALQVRGSTASPART